MRTDAKTEATSVKRNDAKSNMISPAYILHVNNDIVPGCLYRRPFSPGWSSQQQAFPKILLVPSIHPFHRLIPGPSSSNSIPSYSVHASLLVSLLRLVISQRLGKEGDLHPHESPTLDIFASENHLNFFINREAPACILASNVNISRCQTGAISLLF